MVIIVVIDFCQDNIADRCELARYGRGCDIVHLLERNVSIIG
jgi:hypothetical protein